MKTILDPVSIGPAPSYEVVQLRARLAEAEETLRAIRNGEVDAVVGGDRQGSQVFTLEGAEHPYRLLIQSMNEGALTLTADNMILYANQCFARMVNCPLEQVIGSSLRRFLSTQDWARLGSFKKGAAKTGSKIQVLLQAGDGSRISAQLSMHELVHEGARKVTVGMVVTNMTECRRHEEMLRALTRRVVRMQEAERGRVALELHDHITQLICAVLVRSQILADKVSPGDEPSKREAVKLREMLGHTAAEVERISRNLRPSVLDELGLPAVLRVTASEFAQRTGLSVELDCTGLVARLPAEIELTLYRILQEALSNVEKHALARRVKVRLTKMGSLVRLTIQDDGTGFDAEHRRTRRPAKGGLGLLGMRERASYVGGEIKIKSGPRAGTEIEVRVPLPPKPKRTRVKTTVL